MPPNNWGYNEEAKMTCDVLIIDEFSMVDLNLFKHVVDAVDFKHTKLLMIGDNAQLPSVSCGNLLHDFMQSKLIPTVTLTKVFRYGEGGLMKIATDVRQCKTYLEDVKQQCTYFGENKNFEYSESSQAWVSELKVRRRYERRRVSRGALHADAGSEQRKRYDDRTLGDDGD